MVWGEVSTRNNGLGWADVPVGLCDDVRARGIPCRVQCFQQGHHFRRVTPWSLRQACDCEHAVRTNTGSHH